MEKSTSSEALPSANVADGIVHLHTLPISTEEEHDSVENIYDRFSGFHKVSIVAILSLCGVAAPVSSTAIFPAIPNVAITFETSPTVINISNSIYVTMMAVSPFFWGPLCRMFGRRWILYSSTTLFSCVSVGTALAPNLGTFFVFRLLTGWCGTAMLIVGAVAIGDLYQPIERATALGWFMSGTLIGPAIGPVIGGIIVTFSSWRNIFWLQAALGGVGTILAVIGVPETAHYTDYNGLSATKGQLATILRRMSPLQCFGLLRRWDICVMSLGSASLVWNMYSLLTPIRLILDPRFHLTTPLQSGLFYLAPGAGYLLGTICGGRWADHVQKSWIQKRMGERRPQDRLRSAVVPMGLVVPGCMLIYGWCVERKKGGIPVVVVAMFFQGLAQLLCFPSINAYFLDVSGPRAPEVVAVNYFTRYLFAALGTAVVLPAVNAMGIGWFSTISAFFVAAGCLGMVFVIADSRSSQENST